MNVEEHGQASRRATNAGGTSCRIHIEYASIRLILTHDDSHVLLNHQTNRLARLRPKISHVKQIA